MNDGRNILDQHIGEYGEKKKSKLPVFLIFLIALGFGGYYYWASSKKNLDSSKDENVVDKSKNDNIDDEVLTREIAKGSDFNTSGKEVLSTKKETVEVDGNEYEFKIEKLKSGDKYYQNVYFNGYKIIDDSEIFLPNLANPTEEELDELAETIIAGETRFFKIKDKSIDQEYLMFIENNSADYTLQHVYIVKTDGEIIGKLITKTGSYLFWIEAKEDPNIMSSHSCGNPGNYCLYSDGLVSFEDNYLLYIDSDELKKNLDTCDESVGPKPITEYRLTIDNEKIVKEVNYTYKTSDGYGIVLTSGDFAC